MHSIDEIQIQYLQRSYTIRICYILFTDIIHIQYVCNTDSIQMILYWFVSVCIGMNRFVLYKYNTYTV